MAIIISTNITGKDETLVEKLCSIIAQLEYNCQIDMWNNKGVPFKNRIYVPETHAETKVEFCEREDEGHIFKVYKGKVHM